MSNKIFFLTLLNIFFLSFLKAQNNVGIGTITPNPKAILELSATDMGVLLPRLTTTERLALNPTGLNDAALLVYDTNDSIFYYWNSTKWVSFPQNVGSNNISLNYDSNTSNLNLTDAGGTLSTTIPADNQNLSFNGQTLSISNGNSVDITSFFNYTNEHCIGTQSQVSQQFNLTNATGININNGLCFLTFVTGKFEGGGEQVHVTTSGNDWILKIQNAQPQGLVRSCARCYRIRP